MYIYGLDIYIYVVYKHYIYIYSLVRVLLIWLKLGLN